MITKFVPSLRAVLVALLVGTVLFQVLLPVLAEEIGGQYDETAHLVVPYSVAGILAIVCAQVILIMIWRLLSLVTDDTIFTAPALRWVDIIIASGAAAALLAAGVPAHLLFVVGVGGPGEFLLLVTSILGGLAFVLLMAVMRDLLRAAITHRSELDEVI